MRIRLDINALSAISLEAAQGPAHLQDIIQRDLARHHDQTDQRLGAIESLLEAQAAQLAASQSNQFGNIYGPRYRWRPKNQAKKGTQHPKVDGNDSTAVRVNHYNSCRPRCLCICHVESRSSTPGFVDRVLGQVFIGYSGLPGLNTKCDVETCQKTQSPNMSFEYWFPLGFVWSQILRLRFTYERNLGPHFEISTLRRVPDSAQVVTFALNGDIDGLKDLFRREALRCLTQDSDFVDEQNYTLLHRIVLGLSMQDLGEALSQHSNLIDVSDAMGRTALAWASARGDERSVVTLLQHGAEVNTVDVQLSGVVGHAADRNYVTCVRLLLEAGANPDIAASYGSKVGNPLNVAARNASDPLILKTLLDFGADVDSAGVDGTTALIHAARKDNANFATLLLEYGADINALSTAGQTPLTTAVIFNSHNVLQLLLDRWFEYSECPRLKGPHLLQNRCFVR
ncbi:MAG: hypothetical protein Q9208_001585 [Pyrenodesmia sp. 3 TL-2023]